MSIVKIVVIVHIQFWGKRSVELNLFLSFWHFELLLIKLLNLYRHVCPSAGSVRLLPAY